MSKRIFFIACYDNSDKCVNGFIQLYNLFKTDNTYDSALLKVHKIWKKGEFGSLAKRGIRVLFPFLKFRFTMFLKKYFIAFPEKEDVYALIFNSDPYALAIHKEMIEYFRPEAVIYRQSDPMALVGKDALIVDYESELMKASNQVWVANNMIKEKMHQLGYRHVQTLANPYKVPGDRVGDNSFLLDTLMSEKDKYLSIGIYYGKPEIDFQLIDSVSRRKPRTAFFIIGDYTPSLQFGSNVYFIPYQPLADIIEAIKLSDFFFVPYRKRGAINDLLYVTSKILTAASLKKPVLAYGVSGDLKNLNIYVGDSVEYFIEKIDDLDKLSPPSIVLDDYSEDRFLQTALRYLKSL